MWFVLLKLLDWWPSKSKYKLSIYSYFWIGFQYRGELHWWIMYFWNTHVLSWTGLKVPYNVKAAMGTVNMSLVIYLINMPCTTAAFKVIISCVHYSLAFWLRWMWYIWICVQWMRFTCMHLFFSVNILWQVYEHVWRHIKSWIVLVMMSLNAL